MRRNLLLLLSAVLFFDTVVAPAFADNRVALVIGNGAYAHVPHLPNPPHDAEDVAAALKRSGFETIVGLDLDQAGMQDAAIRFARAARTADVALFYYSGHAMQYAGINYLIPVDAELHDEADLRRMAKVDDILSDLQQAKNLRILVLDSCRDNPLADALKRSVGISRGANVGKGLAKMESPDGTIISYSTQSGRTAEDGDGRNSPYTSAFLKHIEDEDDISAVFHHISAAVYETTGGKQVPELSLSFFGEFYLNGRLQVTLAPGTPSPSIDRCAAAEAHWKSAETIGTLEVFEDHLARFPNCAFVGLAKARIEKLKSKEALAPTPAPILPTSPGTLKAGLVAHWPLDADTTNWTTNTTRDVSGSNNTGAMFSMSADASITSGKIGEALKFNGRNYILSSTNLTAISLGTEYSLAVWLKTSSANAGGASLVAYSHTRALQFIGIGVRNNRLTFFNKDDAGHTAVLGGFVQAQDGNWHHIVGIRSGSSYKLYVDGSNAGQLSNSTLGIITPDCFSIGFNCHLGGMFYYNGALDDVRIYNRALSEQEVAQLYSTGR